jgi:hypothetical protein
LVPNGRKLYVFPDQILHYIEAHHYQPPDAFLRAVKRVDPRGPAYKQRCIELWCEMSGDDTGDYT